MNHKSVAAASRLFKTSYQNSGYSSAALNNFSYAAASLVQLNNNNNAGSKNPQPAHSHVQQIQQRSHCSSLSCSRLPNSNASIFVNNNYKHFYNQVLHGTAQQQQQAAHYTSASNDVDSPEFYCVKHVPTCAISTVILRPTTKATTGFEVLLIQRGNKHAHKMWALPGGRIEYGINLLENAKREVEEETGLPPYALHFSRPFISTDAIHLKEPSNDKSLTYHYVISSNCAVYRKGHEHIEPTANTDALACKFVAVNEQDWMNDSMHGKLSDELHLVPNIPQVVKRAIVLLRKSVLEFEDGFDVMAKQ